MTKVAAGTISCMKFEVAINYYVDSKSSCELEKFYFYVFSEGKELLDKAGNNSLCTCTLCGITFMCL